MRRDFGGNAASVWRWVLRTDSRITAATGEVRLLAAYVIAVKRTSVLFAVLFGRMLFGEPSSETRLLGAAVMLAGLLLITLG